MRDLLLLFRVKLRKLFTLDDSAEEAVVIDGIRSAVEFRGAKLWILMLAVFVASLGLNTNSAAVIIGAMLISPLMGPIIGMGLGMAIYDSELLRRSVRNFLIATLFSVVTATLYFLISPYSVAQSELLARTSPTIYDVLIAFCGGLAGIIALSSRSQRQGNVIPGVAIATALMPPLCTIGFGVANGNWHYIFGALYLFLINSIFIALATYLGANFIMRFQKVTDADPIRNRRNKRLITILVVLTIVPSVVLTIGMIRQTYFTQHVAQFIQQEMHWRNTQVVTHRADYDARTLSVVLIGQEVDSTLIRQAELRLPNYGLEGVALQVIQSNSGVNEEELQSMFDANRVMTNQHEALIAQHQTRITDLEHQLSPYNEMAELSPELLGEMQLLWPSISEVITAKGFCSQSDSTVVSSVETLVVLRVSKPLKKDEETKLRAWINARTKQECRIYIQ